MPKRSIPLTKERNEMAIGHHKMEYEVLQGWEQLPEGWSFVEVAGVAVDSRDRVYVFNRGEHPVIAFDKEGQFLKKSIRLVT